MNRNADPRATLQVYTSSSRVQGQKVEEVIVDCTARSFVRLLKDESEAALANGHPFPIVIPYTSSTLYRGHWETFLPVR